MRFYDTSSLLLMQEKAFYEPFMISSVTIQELEHIKTSKNKTEDIRCSARNLVRLLKNNSNYKVVIHTTDIETVLMSHLLPITNDNLIVASAYMENETHQIEFVTDDLILALVAETVFNLTVQKAKDDKTDLYKGYREVTINDEQMALLYENLNRNTYGLLTNEYLLIRNSDGDIIDKRKWDGESYKAIQYKPVNNDYTGCVKSVNLKQDLAFDLLQDASIPIKVLTGLQGSGKDYLMLSHALDFVIKKHKFDKVIWIRNNIEVENTKGIGFLPGSMNEKLNPFAQIIADHVGGQLGLDYLVSKGQIEFLHLGLARGRSIKNSIILSSEAQNLTKEHVRMLMGRVGEGSMLWLNGDFEQADSVTFRENSGLKTLIDKLKGNENFGMVEFDKSERSKVAELASMLN